MSRLGDYPVAAVLRAEDLARARKFYTEVLGLTEKTAPGASADAVFTAGDGTTLHIYERPAMPAPENTTLGFAVPAENFGDVMTELRSKGVKFEDYDIPEVGLKTVDGIAEMDGGQAAWFTDTEGNIISINSR